MDVRKAANRIINGWNWSQRDWLTGHTQRVIALVLTVGSSLVGIGLTWTATIKVETHSALLVAMAALLLVWLAWRRGGWQQSPLDGALILWVVAFAVSTVSNTDVLRRSAIAWWFSGLYVVVWYVLHDLLANGRLTRARLVDGLLIASIHALLPAATQITDWWSKGAQGIPRPWGGLDNPNTFGTGLLIMLALSAARALSVRGVWRWWWSAYAVLTAVLLFLSQSRGAWLGAFAAVVVVGLLILERRGARMNALLLAGIALSAVVVLMAVFAFRSATDGRPRIWEAAVQAFSERPLTGWGPNTAGRTLLRLIGVNPGEVPHTHMHGQILNVAAELGVVGLLALIVSSAAIWGATRRNWHTTQGETRYLIGGGIAALVAIAVHHLVDTTITLPAIALMTLVVVLITVGHEGHAVQPSATGTNAAPRTWATIMITTALIVVGVWEIHSYNLYLRAIDRAITVGVDTTASAFMQEAIDSDPGLPVYYLAKAYIDYLGNRRSEAIAAFSRYCQLEPYMQPFPHDGAIAVGHYFRIALRTRQVFWDEFNCARDIFRTTP